MPSLAFRGVTLSYPALFEPRKPMQPRPGEGPRAPKYEATFLIPVAMDISEQQKVVFDMLAEKHGDRTKDMIKEGMLYWPFSTKNMKKDGSSRYDKSVYKCSIKATSDNPPGLVDRYVDPTTGKTAILTDRKKMYAGAIVNVLVNPFYFANQLTGVSFGLQVVQWWDTGERIDGRINPEDAFQGEPLPEGGLSNGADTAPAATGPGSKTTNLNDLFGLS